MSDTQTQEVVEQQAEQPPPQEQAAVEQPAADAVERDIDADTLEIPDSSAEGGKVKYVPASALAGARKAVSELKAELETAKTGSAKAQQLEAQLQQMQGQLQHLTAKAQAYDAAVAAQQTKPQTAEDSPEDLAELQEIARDFDFYKPDGALDLDKARRQQSREAKRAVKIAQQEVAPLARHTVQTASRDMLARAKATVAPNGQKPDPAVLEEVWNRLDPSLTATPEGAKQAWAVALGYSAATKAVQQETAQPGQQRGTDGKFTTKEDIPDPLYTEKAGGRDTPAAVQLSDKERQYIKEAGMSEKEYLESANSAPWLRGGR